MNTDSRKVGYRLTLLATVLAGIVVVLGAFTRLVDAGLGCPDWPGCYGHLLWPNSQEEINAAEKLFPDAPVETDKTWPEMVHRYFAGTLGLIIGGIGIVAWRNRKNNNQPVKLPLFLIVLVIIQALFGMWTVTLKLWPQIVTAHLLGGFTTLSLLWLLSQRLRGVQWEVTDDHFRKIRSIRTWAVLGLIAVIVQIALGGWTSSNYAALACVDFPTCHGSWWPDTNFAQGFNIVQKIGPNYLGGVLESDARTAIHISHRIGALSVFIILLYLSFLIWQIDFKPAKNVSVVLLLVLITQFLLGISNVLGALPLSVAVAHNGVGALLLLVMVFINHRLFTVNTHST